MQNAEFTAHESNSFDSNEPDSLFGICQAAGEDLGISPFILRVGLIALLFFGPWMALGAYAGLGVVVGISRLLFPKPLSEKPAEAVTAEHQIAFAHDECELIAA